MRRRGHGGRLSVLETGEKGEGAVIARLRVRAPSAARPRGGRREGVRKIRLSIDVEVSNEKPVFFKLQANWTRVEEKSQERWNQILVLHPPFPHFEFFMHPDSRSVE